MFEISATGESVSTLCVVSERAGMPPSVSAVFAAAHFVCRERARRCGASLTRATQGIYSESHHLIRANALEI